MKQSTITTIQEAKDRNLIVSFALAPDEAKRSKAQSPGQIIAIWASPYEKQLTDALVDLYQPQELLFQEIGTNCESFFLFVNTSIQSILCLYLGRKNCLNMLQLDKSIKKLDRDSKDWKRFTKIDKFKALDKFADALEEFGRCALHSNQLPALAENIEIMLAENPDQQVFHEWGGIFTREELEEDRVEAELVENEGLGFLSIIKQTFPDIGWGDLNNMN